MPHRGQFPHQQFALYLQTHCQKENGHQAVVNEFYHLQRMPAVRKQIEVADAQMQLLKQEILVYGRQGRIGNHSGQSTLAAMFSDEMFFTVRRIIISIFN